MFILLVFQKLWTCCICILSTSESLLQFLTWLISFRFGPFDEAQEISNEKTEKIASLQRSSVKIPRIQLCLQWWQTFKLLTHLKVDLCTTCDSYFVKFFSAIGLFNARNASLPLYSENLHFCKTIFAREKLISYFKFICSHISQLLFIDEKEGFREKI